MVSQNGKAAKDFDAQAFLDSAGLSKKIVEETVLDDGPCPRPPPVRRRFRCPRCWELLRRPAESLMVVGARKKK